jgi:YD repeat-containing protein
MKNRLSSLRLLGILALGSLARGAAAQTYTYDAGDRLTQVTYGDGTTIVYAYDAAGNITSTTVTAQPPGGGGGGGGGCFIATAAYGSALDPHVQVLRTFRDEHLLTNAPGRALCALYGEVSPPLAAFLVAHPWLKPPVRVALGPVVYAIVRPRTTFVVLLATLAFLGWWRRRVRLA